MGECLRKHIENLMGTPWELDGNLMGTVPNWMLLRISLASDIENLMGTHWEH
jgi:hypothetical protein